MAYSTVDDLLLGDMAFSDRVDKTTFIDDAADEIDSKIGVLYALPLNISLLDTRAKATLKRINNWLATGRLILSMAAGDKDLNKYAEYMITTALAALAEVASGAVGLGGAVLADTSANSGTGPSILNHDSVSAIDVFEAAVMGWTNNPFPASTGPPLWQPGKNG